ncbi:unnamed protein product [Nippostrongylus brasiliensis]|uniref:Uncharacterized protein n=1 Tax=Nippostrongylus brasiliensis TaxID=27835 RepID=A0A0N4XKX5_NIPBR|nr:unnamed protein product [Nippostrongylus brasiliensis]
MAGREEREFFVNFVPIPPDQLWGEDKGCEARVCDGPLENDACSVQVKGGPQEGTLTLNVPLFNRLFNRIHHNHHHNDYDDNYNYNYNNNYYYHNDYNDYNHDNYYNYNHNHNNNHHDYCTTSS